MLICHEPVGNACKALAPVEVGSPDLVPSHACFAQMGSFQKLWSGVKPASVLDTRKPSQPCFHKAPQRNDNRNTPAVLTVSPGAVQTEGLWDWISFCHQPFSVLLAFLKMVFQCFRPLLSSGNRAEFSSHSPGPGPVPPPPAVPSGE